MQKSYIKSIHEAIERENEGLCNIICISNKFAIVNNLYESGNIEQRKSIIYINNNTLYSLGYFDSVISNTIEILPNVYKWVDDTGILRVTDRRKRKSLIRRLIRHYNNYKNNNHANI